tara:strand:- start:270 stop:602 length:333 start_codon:yes stop_codon:yes gene_type:complete
VEKDQMNSQRLEKFNKWWKKSHHDTKSHYWLAKHSRRVSHNYHTPPEQYDHLCSIMKRYNLGEYKRFSKKDAEFLWRLIHPTMNHRREKLLSSALFFQEQAEAVKRKFSK